MLPVRKSIDFLNASMKMTQQQHKIGNMIKNKQNHLTLRFGANNAPGPEVYRSRCGEHGYDTVATQDLKYKKKPNHLMLRFGAHNASGPKIQWFPRCEHGYDTSATQGFKSEERKKRNHLRLRFGANDVSGPKIY